MPEYLLDSLFDTLKLLPYLFLTFLILEFIEHKLTKKSLTALSNYRKLGPVLGGLLGGFPQCGFSAMSAGLYANKVITMGTLIAVFLSTSDEMIFVMLGENAPPSLLFGTIGLKIAIGIFVGLIVDLIVKSRFDKQGIKTTCKAEHCHCEKGIFLSSLIHTLKISLFILAANLLVDTVLFLIPETTLLDFLEGNRLLAYFSALLVGLIPSCAGSVILTEVYLSGLLTFGALMTGLLMSSGVGLLLLLKSNKSPRENLTIFAIISAVSLLAGFLCDLL